MDHTTFRCGFIAIVGRPNVGKSTLMNHLIAHKVSITSKKAQTTRHSLCGIYTDKQAQFIFVDTPGFQSNAPYWLSKNLNRSVCKTLQTVDCVLMVIEAAKWSDEDLAIIQLLPHNRPVILVINKADKIKTKSVLEGFAVSCCAHYNFAGVDLISAKHHQGLTSLVSRIREWLPLSLPLYPPDEITNKSSRFLAGEIIQEKIFRYLGEEIPYVTVVNIIEFEQRNGRYHIRAVVLVKKESQKAILIGKNGEKLKKIATEARIDMEKMLHNAVFLSIWVKVNPNYKIHEPLSDELLSKHL